MINGFRGESRFGIGMPQKSIIPIPNRDLRRLLQWLTGNFVSGPVMIPQPPSRRMPAALPLSWRRPISTDATANRRLPPILGGQLLDTRTQYIVDGD